MPPSLTSVSGPAPHLPTVSLLVAVRNEAPYIADCLTSIFAQDYPSERLEVSVLDGLSSDISREIVARRFLQRPACRLLTNSKIIQAAGWNAGIRESSGQIIGIVSAHSALAPNYVSTAVDTLMRTGADMVGGPTSAFSGNSFGKAVALALGAPFGVGGARFHYSRDEIEVDTVFMGLCWRRLYERIGGFDEEMVRNQDDELSYRLRENGGRIVCNPAISSRYYGRSTIPGLWRQYFQYGLWKVRVLQKHPRQMRLRQFVPPVFVASLLGSALAAPILPAAGYLFGAIAGSYALANLIASVRLASKHGLRYLLALPVAFGAMHLSYGLGFLVGLVKFARRWRDRQGKVPIFRTAGG